MSVSQYKESRGRKVSRSKCVAAVDRLVIGMPYRDCSCSRFNLSGSVSWSTPWSPTFYDGVIDVMRILEF